EGMALRTPGNTIRLAGRATQGVRIIKMSRSDQVVSVAVLEGSPVEQGEHDELEPGENGNNADENENLLDMPIDAVEDADVIDAEAMDALDNENIEDGENAEDVDTE